MGNLFSKGAVAVRRFVVLDFLPQPWEARFLKGIRAHAFLSIDPASEQETTHGWVAPTDEDDNDLTASKVYATGARGTEMRLGMRVDTLKPPVAEVKRQVAARAAAIEAAEGRKVSRRERRLLKDEVTRALRQRTFPRRKVVQAVWLLEEHRIYFGAQSKAMVERFIDLFAKSFGVRIDTEGPARWAAWLVDAGVLAKLEPTRELWLGFEGVRPLSTEAASEEEAA